MFRNKVKRGLKAPIPVRPELRDGREAKAPAPKAAVVPPPKPPKTPTPAAKRSRRSNRGRLSARPQQRAVELGGPEVVELARPVARPSVLDLGPPEVVSDSRPQPSPASAPVDRRPPGKPIGLDDLFGGSPEGRVRMRSRKLASGEADETSEA